MLALHRYATAAEFLADAGPFLLGAEAENNLILGIAGDLAAKGGAGASIPPYFAAVRDGEQFVLCAFRTVPDKLGLTRCEHREAWGLLAADVIASCPEVTSVLGPEPGVNGFAEFFAARTQRRAAPRMRQRIHELRVVAPLPAPPDGRLRLAQVDDLECVVPWVAGFLREVGETGDAEGIARGRIGGGQLFLWEAKGPVSMAACSGKTPNGIRVNFVFTPEAHRGRGYATACVAALTRHLLEAGNRFCCLYTDLANPTSNGIYRRIGYQPVCDAGYYSLGA